MGSPIPTIVLTPACLPGQGGGHVVRGLALARALEAAGATCAFVAEPGGVDLLRRLGWTGAAQAATGEGERLAAIHALHPAAVAVDDYRLDAAFEHRLPGVVLAIDDLADRPHACALLLDSAYGRTEGDYADLAPGARLLLGPDYALLRAGFAGGARTPRETVKRIFIAFGLSDVGGIAARAVRLLRPLAPDAVFDIALASDAASVAELRAMTAADHGVVLHLDADVGPLMRAADLGVGAGGGMVWERRAAGLPQLVVALADNQRPMASRLAADGVIRTVDLADPEFEARLADEFVRLLSIDVRRALIDCPNARCDGRGAARAAMALLSVLA